MTRRGFTAGPVVTPPQIIGSECIGVVEAVSPELERAEEATETRIGRHGAKYRAGDVVIALMGGMGRTFDGCYAGTFCCRLCACMFHALSANIITFLFRKYRICGSSSHLLVRTPFRSCWIVYAPDLSFISFSAFAIIRAPRGDTRRIPSCTWRSYEVLASPHNRYSFSIWRLISDWHGYCINSKKCIWFENNSWYY